MVDYNSDHSADIVAVMKADPAEDGRERYAFRTYVSRRDGHFGPYESDGDNKNLYPTCICDEKIVPLYLAGGDMTGDGVPDLALVANFTPRKDEMMFYGVFPVEAPAYDYSSHVIKTDDGYILYTGGLYTDYNTDKYNKTDADHIYAYTSEDGITWHRNLDGACFYPHPAVLARRPCLGIHRYPYGRRRHVDRG